MAPVKKAIHAKKTTTVDKSKPGPMGRSGVKGGAIMKKKPVPPKKTVETKKAKPGLMGKSGQRGG